MRREIEITKGIDWITVGIYCFIAVWGWMNIYATVYDSEVESSIFDFTLNSGKQLVWMGSALVLIIIILNTDHSVYEAFAYVIYGLMILSLISVLIFGKEVAGSRSWFEIGSVRIQPSEFAKFSVALALAKYLSSSTIKVDRIKVQITAAAIIGLPAILILLQNDTGSFLVFSVFLVVLYREGMSPFLLIAGLVAVALFVLTLVMNQFYLWGMIGILSIIAMFFGRWSLKKTGIIIFAALVMIAYTKSISFFISDVLQEHQQNRIKALINPDADPTGFGWNVIQSKIAIGSGRFLGKGYLEGTHTKYDFVPEQSTDFIFCTIGEEWGFLGAFILIILYLALFARIIYLAEKQKTRFARVYGYSVVAIMFLHFMVNIGMTIGLFPVIGIPLPMMSYGGSSLWSFTILLFVFINFDASKRLLL